MRSKLWIFSLVLIVVVFAVEYDLAQRYFKNKPMAAQNFAWHVFGQQPNKISPIIIAVKHTAAGGADLMVNDGIVGKSTFIASQLRPPRQINIFA